MWLLGLFVEKEDIMAKWAALYSLSCRKSSMLRSSKLSHSNFPQLERSTFLMFSTFCLFLTYLATSCTLLILTPFSKNHSFADSRSILLWLKLWLAIDNRLPSYWNEEIDFLKWKAGEEAAAFSSFSDRFMDLSYELFSERYDIQF
jgi:hypothetical protein